MEPFIDFINHADFCGTLVLISFLWFVGSKAVERHPALHRVGCQFAAIGFLAYALYSAFALCPTTPDEFLGVGLRGLLAGGLIAGTAWIILPLLAYVYDHTFGPLISGVRSCIRVARQRHAERRAKAQDEARRRQADKEYQREAPHRERLQRDAEASVRQQADAQKRRDDARASCEVLYSLYAPDIGQRFDRQVFNDFVAKYMDDKHPPEYVEERAQQLQALLQQHFEKVEPSPKFKSLADLAQWFQRQKEQVETMPDGRLKNMLIAKLHGRYAELTSQFLEEMEP
jgi:hypothetical protein